MRLDRAKRFLLILCLTVLFGWIPFQIAIATYQVPYPQAIFVLGGDYTRTQYATQLWQSHKNMTIWISDCPSDLKRHRQILAQAGISAEQIRLDDQATDTVTNFTTLVNQFSQQHFRHLYLITSDYHLARATAIATIVLGSRGIIVTPARVPSQREPESMARVVRDCVRSVLWLVTSRTGASFNPQFKRCSSHFSS